MILNVVATPIGNLADCSPRAKEVFEQATVIIAEDTRVIKKLFSLLEITPRSMPLFHSLHARTERDDVVKFLKTLKKDDIVVLVTDAGTPTISDPGAVVVHEFRALYPDGLIAPIPGPTAAIAALSVSGFSGSHYEFFGFLPHKKGRQTLFKRIAETEHIVVLYESPHRILKTLEALASALGERAIMVGREMTKQFEEYPIGTAKKLFEYYSTHPDKVRGEFVIVISPTYQKADFFDTIAG